MNPLFGDLVTFLNKSIFTAKGEPIQSEQKHKRIHYRGCLKCSWIADVNHTKTKIFEGCNLRQQFVKDLATPCNLEVGFVGLLFHGSVLILSICLTNRKHVPQNVYKLWQVNICTSDKHKSFLKNLNFDEFLSLYELYNSQLQNFGAKSIFAPQFMI